MVQEPWVLEGKKEKKRNHKAGKMAQWIRALTTIQRTRVQLPASTWQLVPPVTQFQRIPYPLLASASNRVASGTQTYIQVKHIHAFF